MDPFSKGETIKIITIKIYLNTVVDAIHPFLNIMEYDSWKMFILYNGRANCKNVEIFFQKDRTVSRKLQIT